MRAVLDPNVLISAVLSPRGAPAELIRRWRAGDFELVISDAVLEELERVLTYPKLAARVSSDDAIAYVTLLRRRAEVAPDPPDPAPRAPDPGDDYLVALAEAQRAALVSGDRHLLGLAGRFPVLGPREFVELLDARTP